MEVCTAVMEGTRHFVLKYQHELFFAWVLVVLGIAAYFVHATNTRGDMGRTKELRQKLADGIVDLVEDWYYKKEVTDREREFFYRWTGKALVLKELFPKNSKSLDDHLKKGSLLKTLMTVKTQP